MDQESLEKWKQEFQNERKEQFNKVKELKKETYQRRKAMEMKIQLEAAKEEKRRKEMLAERRAQHVEATMRYQRGLKNFKVNKEKVSLEEVLSKINPPRAKSGNTVDDDRVIVYNNMYKDLNRTPNESKLKKSSSFDNLSSLTFYNQSDNVKHENNNNSKNNNHSVKSTIFGLKQNDNINKVNNNSNNINYDEGKTNNFKDMLNENQKTIQEFNKEALKNFQNLVSNEMKYIQMNKFINQQQQPNQFMYNTDELKRFNFTLNPSSNHFNNSDNLNITNLKNFYETNSDITSIDDNGIDDEKYNNFENNKNSKNIIEDSIETDSLINLKIEMPNEKIKISKNENKLDNNDEYQNGHIINSNSYFNLVNRNLISNKETTPLQINNYNYTDSSNLISNIENFSSIKKNHFFNSKNTSNNSELNYDQKLNENRANRVNFLLKKEQDRKEIKSILKRSSSLDNGCNPIGLLGPTVNFGLKGDTRSLIKDSVELANNRYQKFKTNSAGSDGAKKSVRFASQLNQEHRFFSNDLKSINSNAINQTQQTIVQIKSIPIHENSNNSNNIELKQNETNPSHPYSRISSANSIRRPIVRPRNTVNSNKTMDQKLMTSPLDNNNPTSINTNTPNNSNININNAESNNKIAKAKETDFVFDEKPPAYPSTNQLLTGNGGGYALLSQKRKEILKNNRINSPKATLIKNETTIPIQINNENDSPAPINKAQFQPVYNQQQEQHTQLKAQPPQHLQLQIEQNSINKISNLNLKSPNLSNIQEMINNTRNNQQMNNFNYSNLKYNEISYREYQAAKLNNDLNTNAATPTTISIMNQNAIKYRLNNTDPNLFRRNNNVSYGEEQYGPNNNFKVNSNIDVSNNDSNNINNNASKKPIEAYTLTKIPLSPKSNLKSNYCYFYGPHEKQQIEHNSIQRPSSNSNEPLTSTKATVATKVLNNIGNSPLGQGQIVNNVTPTVTIQNTNIPVNLTNTNIRFAYLNLNQTNMNNNQIPLASPVTALTLGNIIGQRAFSADNAGQHYRLQNLQNHYEVKYPLYSHYQTQNNNSTKNNNEKTHEADLTLADSMATFLRAEEMSAKEFTTESQIINAVKDMQNKNHQIKNVEMTLSMEEQNVKNSIMRLNERLKTLKNDNNQRRYNQDDNFINTPYRNKPRPLSSNVLKCRR